MHATDRVRIGGSVTVNDDEVVNGNVVAIGGAARVDGEVNGDVVAVGGGVDLGPGAAVSRNVVVVGGVLRRDPAARIGGSIQEIGALDFSRWRPLRAWWLGSTIGAAFTLMATLTRVAVCRPRPWPPCFWRRNPRRVSRKGSAPLPTTVFVSASSVASMCFRCVTASRCVRGPPCLESDQSR